MRIDDFLLEYNRDQTVKNYGQKILQVALADHSIDFQGNFQGVTTRQQIAKDPEKQAEILNYVMGVIEQADPTKNKNYSQAITKLYANGDVPIEDIATTMADDIIKFEKLKRKKKLAPEHADFMRYKSVYDFYRVISQYPNPDAEGAQEVDVTKVPEGLDYEVVYGSFDNHLQITSDMVVIQVKNMEANQFWARIYPTPKCKETNKWCTARLDTSNMFKSYAPYGRIYVVIPRDRNPNTEKYQFYFPDESSHRSAELKDDNNQNFDVAKLVARLPNLSKIFAQDAIKNHLPPLIPEEYKLAIANYAGTASKELGGMLEKFVPRIARFGFQELRNPQKYGVDVRPETEEAIVPAIEEFIQQFAGNLQPFWAKVSQQLGAESNADRLEVILNDDKVIQGLLENSKASKLIAQLATEPEFKGKMDFGYLRDVLMRDPVFRVVITQTPKLYTNMIQQLNAQHLKEGAGDIRTAKAIAQELHQDLHDLNQLIAANPEQGHTEYKFKLKDSIADLYEQLQDLGFNYDPTTPDLIKPLTMEGSVIQFPKPQMKLDKPSTKPKAKQAPATVTDLKTRTTKKGNTMTGPTMHSIYEGKMKNIDIGRQDMNTMSKNQFFGQYDQTKDAYATQHKGLLNPKKSKRTRAKPENTVEAYVEYYDKNDRRQFGTMSFPSEEAARKWADKNNATIHNIIPLHKVAETKVEDVPKVVENNQELDRLKALIGKVK